MNHINRGKQSKKTCCLDGQKQNGKTTTNFSYKGWHLRERVARTIYEPEPQYETCYYFIKAVYIELVRYSFHKALEEIYVFPGKHS